MCPWHTARQDRKKSKRCTRTSSKDVNLKWTIGRSFRPATSSFSRSIPKQGRRTKNWFCFSSPPIKILHSLRRHILTWFPSTPCMFIYRAAALSALRQHSSLIYKPRIMLSTQLHQLPSILFYQNITSLPRPIRDLLLSPARSLPSSSLHWLTQDIRSACSFNALISSRRSHFTNLPVTHSAAARWIEMKFGFLESKLTGSIQPGKITI